MDSFTNIKALIIDMDGVLWHGDQAIPGLAEFFQTIRDKQLPFILATNNARLTPKEYIDKLNNMGIVVASHEILTSGMATAFYLAQHYNPVSTKIFVIGENGARQPLIDQGFSLTGTYQLNGSDESLETADLVVCGLDKNLSWEKLSTATINIRAGAKLIGTNGDTTLPSELGLVLGNGAVLAALTAATNTQPTIVGKPEPIMYQQAMTLLGTKPSETIAIGDRLDTDILGAVRTNIRSIMVLTGVSSKQDLLNIDYKPTWIMPDIRDITRILKNI